MSDNDTCLQKQGQIGHVDRIGQESTMAIHVTYRKVILIDDTNQRVYYRLDDVIDIGGIFSLQRNWPLRY